MRPTEKRKLALRLWGGGGFFHGDEPSMWSSVRGFYIKYLWSHTHNEDK